MNYVEDDVEYWLGIGYLVSNIRFSANIVKANSGRLGYRLQLKVWNPQDKKYGSPLARLLDKDSEQYTSVIDIEKVVVFLDKIQKTYGFSTHRDTELRLVKYCLKNPPDYSTWESFTTWVDNTHKVYESLKPDLVIKESENLV